MKNCKNCDQPFESANGQKFCSDKCRSIHWQNYNRDYQKKYDLVQRNPKKKIRKKTEHWKMTCHQCGKEFIGKSPAQKFCTKWCKTKANPKPKPVMANCKECGKRFKKGNNAKFCSKDCSSKYKEKNRPHGHIGSIDNCKKCGKPFTVLSPIHAYCSHECCMVKYKSTGTKDCKSCGKPFTPKKSYAAKYCSEECRKIGLKRAYDPLVDGVKARIKYQTNKKHRLAQVLRGRVKTALKSQNATKNEKTTVLLGCSVEFLRQHLESQFSRKMTWENYGNYWHIDHIVPCHSFDLTDPEQQKICFNWQNLQPLEAKENISKNNKLTQPQMHLPITV
ncbi:MAG: hypothetical protein HQM14_21210 [SAR324 cluster bacterium]|nr:hypothetical protein [SAR324 cluster bacterium]